MTRSTNWLRQRLVTRSMDGRIDSCLADLAAAREDVLRRDQALEQARGEVQALRHELASLQAMQDAALGSGVQEAVDWIAAQGLESATRLGQTLAVVPGWELAVETVLGEFLSALGVDDLDRYATSLAELADGDLALVDANASGDGLVDTSAVENRLGLPALASLVRGAGHGAGTLLHGVFAAESTEVALSLRAQLSDGHSIITREGFWVGADWVRVLHDRSEQAGIIERGQAIETCSVQVEEAETRLADLQQEVQGAKARVEQLEEQREALQKQLNELNQTLSQRRTDHGVTRVKFEEAAARRAQLQAESEDINEQVAQESTRLQQTRLALAETESIRETLQADRQQLAAEREQMTTELDERREQARLSRDRFHALNVQQQGLQTRLAASETARQRLLEQQASLTEQERHLQSGVATSETPLPELEAELEEKLQARVTIEGQLGEIRAAMGESEQATQSQEQARHQFEAGVDEIRQQLEGVRVERQGLVVQESTVLEQLTGTGHELEAVQAKLPEEANEAQWQEDLQRLERRIQRLGAINLAAIEEYEQESERKIYLDAQAEDLESALTTLVDAITKIDKETRSRFKDTFEAVNSRLGQLFPKVFGGGHAYLELTGEDLLDTGVSLMARPPGKRNASVHLLSGGEKAMTAVALIFAIFHLNPSPVCLLDEVDAPLDDANVSRFAALIEEMSADVQFLVITHNKITMEMADYLMGVTMQEAGVSRLVSVDVDEAAAMAVS